ncbi:rhomboid family intramembrane serine protease, partial [Mesorhizobium sp. M7A.F.Ca.US.001.01.1.1]
MFIPLYDTNRLRHIRLQYVTIGLIVVNALVYLATARGG